MTATDNPAYKTRDHINVPNLVFLLCQSSMFCINNLCIVSQRLDMHVVLMENILGPYAVTAYKELKYQTTDHMDCGN